MPPRPVSSHRRKATGLYGGTTYRAIPSVGELGRAHSAMVEQLVANRRRSWRAFRKARKVSAIGTVPVLPLFVCERLFARWTQKANASQSDAGNEERQHAEEAP